ncbi:MAG TPA: hypothetical protein VHR42_00220 [Clostridia bacterium]|nr:hypothetical protein [Clostridia bacterium]
MNGLVISWFYPPATSAEGLVTFKLLKNSEFHYDVISAESRQWSYDTDSPLSSPNITVHPVKSDHFSTFIREADETAGRLMGQNHYDFLMTRAMPAQSHTVGLKIKKRSGVFWIASMADPIGRNPYDYDRYFGSAGKILKNPIRTAARVVIYLRNILFENKVIRKADRIVFPSLNQCKYTLGKNYEKYKEKIMIIPHTFDPELCPPERTDAAANERITISHLGHLNGQRSAEGLISALSKLKRDKPELGRRLFFRLIGNIPKEQKELVEREGLTAMISVEKAVDYFESLRIMQESDILLLIDAKFNCMKENIFFASKLADYMGAGRPIIGLTDETGPSGGIIKRSGGTVCNPEDIDHIYHLFRRIAEDGIPSHLPEVYRCYESRLSARKFDEDLKTCLHNK